MNKTLKQKLVSKLATSSGVSGEDVQKILEQLGVDKTLESMTSISSKKAALAATPKIAFRLGRNTVAV